MDTLAHLFLTASVFCLIALAALLRHRCSTIEAQITKINVALGALLYVKQAEEVAQRRLTLREQVDGALEREEAPE